MHEKIENVVDTLSPQDKKRIAKELKMLKGFIKIHRKPIDEYKKTGKSQYYSNPSDEASFIAMFMSAKQNERMNAFQKAHSHLFFFPTIDKLFKEIDPCDYDKLIELLKLTSTVS